MAKLVDALALGASGETRESSNLSFRTNPVQSPEGVDRHGILTIAAAQSSHQKPLDGGGNAGNGREYGQSWSTDAGRDT